MHPPSSAWRKRNMGPRNIFVGAIAGEVKKHPMLPSVCYVRAVCLCLLTTFLTPFAAFSERIKITKGLKVSLHIARPFGASLFALVRRAQHAQKPTLEFNVCGSCISSLCLGDRGSRPHRLDRTDVVDYDTEHISE